ncbi:hypothetical protein ZIOFF_050777 [Zingiber officinale]|uniref:Uncharacterized protein n=1 Tax=Zingiber officinale TaxID=94328 RepID=A0A8J5FS46_ZINOF|nr:hypothetical protein ZIOFF_050777 [Zingiber officinale]
MQIQEISLLGFISCKWIDLIKKFVSHSCDYLPISEQYSLLHRVVEENSKSTHPHIESLSSMEKDIIEYVAALVDSQHHKLWQLPHVLVAAVPLWAIWNDIEKRFVGEASSHIRLKNDQETNARGNTGESSSSSSDIPELYSSYVFVAFHRSAHLCRHVGKEALIKYYEKSWMMHLESASSVDAGDEVFFDDVKRLVRVLRCVTRRWQRPKAPMGEHEKSECKM